MLHFEVHQVFYHGPIISSPSVSMEFGVCRQFPSRAQRRRGILWVVAVVTLFWNGMGAATIMLAQAGRLPDVDPTEAAYYAAQPFWFVITTNIALLAPLAGAIALLLRSGTAPALFAVSVAAILANNAYDLAAGTSLALNDQGWIVVTAISVAVAVLQFVYARTMKSRGVLR